MGIHTMVALKSDKRYKPGNIKREGDTLRGNPETMQIKPLEQPHMLDFINLNPPLVVSRELGEKLKEVWND